MSIGESRPQNLWIICRACGTVNSYGERFCDHCRSLLDRGRIVTETESLEYIHRRDQRIRRRRRLRLGAALGGLLGVAAIVSLWALSMVRSAPLLPPPETAVTAASAAGEWVAEGFDLQNTRFVPGDHPPLKGEPKWSFEASAEFLASPAVAGGIVYAATGDGRLVALDEETGAVRWEMTGLGTLNSSPTVAGDTVYLGLRTRTVMAVNRHTGEVRWTAETSGSIYASPTVVNGEVFVATAFGNNMVYSFDAATGEVRWQQPVGESAVASMSVYKDRALAAAGQRIYFFDTPTGRKVFTYNAGRLGNMAGAPVIKDGTIYALIHSGFLLAIDLRASGNWWDGPLNRVWGQFWLWGIAPEPPSSGLRGAYQVPGEGFAVGLAASDGAAFVSRAKGQLVAINPQARQELWQFQTEGPVNTAPAVMGGTVYFASGRYLYALNAANGQQLWRFELQDWASADVVVTPKAAYIGDRAGNLYAIR